VIVLYEGGVNAGRRIVLAVVRLHEEPALVPEHVRLHEELRERDRRCEELDGRRQAAEARLAELGDKLREAERGLSSMRRDALELGSFLARAQQNKLALEQSRLTLANTRRNEAAKQLQEIEINLVRMKARQRSLLETMAELALKSGEDVVGASKQQPSFAILRMANNDYEEILASEHALLRPGDIVRVELPGVPDARRVSLE
jgi:polysaccharide export outer membrane protein